MAATHDAKIVFLTQTGVPEHPMHMTAPKIDEASPVTASAISTLVDAFYAKVQHDPTIGPIFNEQVDDWPAHLALLKDFWASVLLGAGTFKGNPLEKHLKLPLSREHFERWLTLFAETARELLPPEQASIFVNKSQRIAETFQRAMAARGAGLGIVPAKINAKINVG